MTKRIDQNEVANPYASGVAPLKQDSTRPPEIALASKFERIVARIVDIIVEGVFYWICVKLLPILSDLEDKATEIGYRK